MDREEYLQTQSTILILAQMVHNMPLGEFLQAIDRADSVGPILDPTLWMRGHDNMHKIGRLAAALVKFQSVAREVVPGVGEHETS